MSFAVFLDFDGTVAEVDVGNRFFTEFCGGANREIVERWIRREVTSFECLQGEADLISATRDELVAYSRQFGIDPGFAVISDMCRSRQVPLRIVSDGLDLYIREIMTIAGYPDVETMANTAEFTEDGIVIEFPYRHQSCGFCGNCKGAAIRQHTPPGCRSIYVGDGFSDLCAIDVADYLFAKDSLADYLSRHNKQYLPFESLQDVANVLQNLFDS